MTTASTATERYARHRRLALGVTVAALVVFEALAPVPLWTQLGIAGLAVVTLGLPHGALDSAVLLRLRTAGGSRSRRSALLLGYVALAAATAAAWMVRPGWALLVFVALSVLHFGRGDLSPAARHARGSWFEALVRGSMPIVLPFAFHPSEVSTLFAWLIGVGASEVQSGLASSAVPLLLIWGGLAATLLLSRARDGGLERDPFIVAELSVLAASFVLLPPLLSFGVYFGVWHSVRHLLVLDEFFGAGRASRRRSVLKSALPVVGATLALGLLAYLLLADRPADPAALVQTMFVGLAALTVPHMIVTWFVERTLRPGPQAEAAARSHAAFRRA